MKQKLKVAVLALAMAAPLSHTSLQAAEAKKTAVKSAGKGGSASKPAIAARSAQKPVQKSAQKTPAQKPSAQKTLAQKPVPKRLAAVPAAKAKLQAKAVEAKKPVHRVTNVFDDPSRLALYSSSALVIDQNSGQRLIEKQPQMVVPIASISKLMTAMVVLDAHLDLQEVIAISDEDVDSLKGTRSRLPVGTTMTRETAMLLALMSSENRAAHALGRHYPGGLHAFVQAMNRKARALGMVNSRFEEPTGLSSNNVSTAEDLARMVTAAARYPEIRHFSTTAEARVDLNGRQTDFRNTNALVRSDTWEIGVSKTGYISEAGRCLVMQARVADKPVVIVLLDSAGKMTRVGDANRIKRWMESASLTQQDRRRV